MVVPFGLENQFAPGREAARFRRKNPRPARPTARSPKLLGSGVAVEATAMPVGPLSPEISAAFTKTPEVVYSDTVPPSALVMYRFVPSVAMPRDADETGDQINGCHSFGLSLTQACFENVRHAAEAQLAQRTLEFDDVHSYFSVPVRFSMRSLNNKDD
jgi:hypothetical protein